MRPSAILDFTHLHVCAVALVSMPFCFLIQNFAEIGQSVNIQLYSPFGRIKIKYKNSQTGHIIKNTQNIDMHAH